MNLLAKRSLVGTEKSFKQFAFADSQWFEPFCLGDLWLGFEPFEKQFQLLGCDFALVDAVNQMTKE